MAGSGTQDSQDYLTQGTISAGSQSVTLVTTAGSSVLISVMSTAGFTGTLSVTGASDMTLSNVAKGNRLLFRAGVGGLGVNTITGTGTTNYATEYRAINGGTGITVTSGATWSGSAIITIYSSGVTATTFVDGPVHTAQEEAARAGRAFAASTSPAAPAAGSFLNTYLSNPSGSGVNIFLYKVTFMSNSTTTVLQYNRIGSPTNGATVATTAAVSGNANVGMTAGAGVMSYGTSTTALAGTGSTIGFIPTNGVPRELPLSPTKLSPGTSVGYFVSGIGGGFFAASPPNMGVGYFWYEEPVA